jgi:hypothetical protein
LFHALRVGAPAVTNFWHWGEIGAGSGAEMIRRDAATGILLAGSPAP